MTPLPTMTAAECAKLLDASMRSAAPEAYAMGVHGAFIDAGRDGDALVAAMIAELHRSDEIELLMRLRAEWLEEERPLNAPQIYRRSPTQSGPPDPPP